MQENCAGSAHTESKLNNKSVFSAEHLSLRLAERCALALALLCHHQ